MMEAATAEVTQTDEPRKKQSIAGQYVVLKKLSEDSLIIVDTVAAPNSKSAVRKVAVDERGNLIEGTYVGVPLSSFKEFTPRVKTNIAWE